ncbi:hypothetical protein Aduo_016722 [Ancylostoma duodenale]
MDLVANQLPTNQTASVLKSVIVAVKSPTTQPAQPNILPKLSLPQPDEKDTRMNDIFGTVPVGKSDPDAAEGILKCSSTGKDAIKRHKCSVVTEGIECFVSKSSTMTTSPT